MEEVIMQGDQYSKPIKISINNQVLLPEQVDNIEVYIANCKKTLKNGDVGFDSNTNMWYLNLYQEDTFSMHEGKQPFQIRLKLTNGEIIGKKLPEIIIANSRSKDVL